MQRAFLPISCTRPADVWAWPVSMGLAVTFLFEDHSRRGS
jgi:hypothetical protein